MTPSDFSLRSEAKRSLKQSPNHIYLLLMGAEGVFKFSLAVGMTVLLLLLLRCKSWSAWIDHSAGSRGGATLGGVAD